MSRAAVIVWPWQIVREGHGIGCVLCGHDRKSSRLSVIGPPHWLYLKGTVNVLNGGHAKTGRFRWALRGDARFGDLAPHDHRPGTKRSIAR
ncbi:MAG: hypothetical protein NT037_18885 [Hyphomicrobiales bacterium]|nr:hypothetical protein [Hyphomicrobiales bacterium]